MQPEEREMLKKALELSRENNKMLQSIKRSMFVGRIFRVVYWIVVIGAAIGAYYYIEPYLDEAIGAYGSIKGDLKNFGDLLK
ncbi:MAG TPA: hypothetical protein VJB58_02975 [Candidatus Paceibacterota bacterium]